MTIYPTHVCALGHIGRSTVPGIGPIETLPDQAACVASPTTRVGFTHVQG